MKPAAHVLKIVPVSQNKSTLFEVDLISQFVIATEVANIRGDSF